MLSHVFKKVLVFLLNSYYSLLKKTVRIEVIGLESMVSELNDGRSPVVACAHNALLPVLLSFSGHPATVVASQSKDGQWIASILEHHGFEVVRGSSSRGGTAALLKLLQAADRGRTLGIAVDGPRGPPLAAKKGVSLCASKSSGSPYFAAALPLPGKFFKNSFSIRMSSWDRFFLPLPFCKLKVEFVKIELANFAREDSESWRAAYLQELNVLMQKTYGFLYLKS